MRWPAPYAHGRGRSTDLRTPPRKRQKGPEEDSPLAKKDPARIARKLHLDRLRAQLLVCTDGDCGSRKQQKEALREARRQVKELGLGRGPGRVVCTGVGCLKVCHGGPIAVVWPDGTFYRDATPENVRRIVREHLGEGRVVEELCIAQPGD